MHIALVVTPFTDENLRLAAQVGVTDIVARFPQWHGQPLEAIQERVVSAGMRLSVIEGYIPHDLIVHGKAGRDEQVAGFQELLREMGRLGVEVCCYNFMPNDDWTRTSLTSPERGGALTTAFDVDHIEEAVGDVGESISADQLWENLANFLERIIPVAEAANVKLALHPDDPPMSPVRGQDCILINPEAFERLFEMFPSPVNGMCFCQGTFAEMDAPIIETIERFAPRIHYAHFRDVEGSVPRFRETFHDNGKTDMLAAMQAYRDIGFTGPIRPDHVPVLEGESTENAGYTMLGRLWAVGYMKGLLEESNIASSDPVPERG